MLITEEYREQNAKLHETRKDYGAYSSRWAVDILEVAQKRGCENILDYGCGKGTLKDAVDLPVVEYDPAIEGKTQALPCDLVACTDVLEHIEPECLEEVLAHLYGMTKKVLFFNISTCPAKKFLSDGRNAHLIVENSEWWREKLEPRFEIVSWFVEANGVWGEAIPLRALNEINSTPAVSNDERNENVRLNCARIKERVGEARDGLKYIPNDRTAVLVCFGPSLKDTWPMVAMNQNDPKADIFTVSAAHKFMIDKGVIPYAHIDCDPRSHKAVQIGKPNKEIKYWLASCIHPDYLDKLEGHEVALWHSYNGPDSKMAIHVNAPGENMVLGGGSVGLRAMSVLFAKGYRKFIIHGMDASNRDGEAYAGLHLGKEKKSAKVKCGDRWFDTSAVLILYCRFFFKQIEMLTQTDPNTSFQLCGDGLLQHMIKTGEKA